MVIRTLIPYIVYGGKISIIHLLLHKVACEYMLWKVIMYVVIGFVQFMLFDGLMVKAYIATSDVCDELT